MNEDEKEVLVNWFSKQPVKWIQPTIDAYNSEFNQDMTLSQARHVYYRTINSKRNEQSKVEEVRQQTNKDGSIVSNVLLKGVGKRNMKPNDLMNIHGFDPKFWTVTRVVSNVWTVNTQEKEKYNFQSKVIVAPIVKEFDIEKAIDEQVKRVKPFELPRLQKKEENEDPYTIVLNIADAHFTGGGVNYSNNLNKLHHKLSLLYQNNKNMDFVINLLGDLVNIDTVKGQTTKGTQLETFDVEGQLNEALNFIDGLMKIVLDVASSIHIQGVNANHDNTLGYYIYRMIEQRYKGIATFDITKKDATGGLMKCYLINGILVGETHGDKRNKNIPMIMATKYPIEWAKATTRELFSGHIHYQKTQIMQNEIDENGIVIRTVPTPKRTDMYEKQNGYVNAKKRFMGAVYEHGETEQLFYF